MNSGSTPFHYYVLGSLTITRVNFQLLKCSSVKAVKTVALALFIDDVGMDGENNEHISNLEKWNAFTTDSGNLARL